MSYFVYILYSKSHDKFYKGQTTNLQNRLARHNRGYEIATKDAIPWILVWSTQKSSRTEALVLEKKLKNLSRERLTRFIRKYSDDLIVNDLDCLLES